MAEDCNKLVAAEARTLCSATWVDGKHPTWLILDIILLVSCTFHTYMSQSESRCGYYEQGLNLHLELFGHWHVYCIARWKQWDVPLQWPQLDTGEGFMYCTMTEFTETWWSSLFHSVFLHLSFRCPYNWTSAYSQQESQACLGKSHVKTCTVVYLLFIITLSSKITLGRPLHSS